MEDTGTKLYIAETELGKRIKTSGSLVLCRQGAYDEIAESFIQRFVLQLISVLNSQVGKPSRAEAK